jgi:hypothetical protein
MDTMNDQILNLSGKVEMLSSLIEQLGDKVSGVVSECRFGNEQIHHQHSERYPTPKARGIPTIGLEAAFEHKDILIDGSGLEPVNHTSDRPLSPEIQIQRLTAQLTAAYNRIAALEEQLLNKRMHQV